MDMTKLRAPSGEESPFNILEDPRDQGHTDSKLVDDEPNCRDDFSEEMSEASDSSESSSRSRQPVDKSVMEDMAKFEESFKGITQRFRLINRIGEGTSYQMIVMLAGL